MRRSRRCGDAGEGGGAEHSVPPLPLQHQSCPAAPPHQSPFQFPTAQPPHLPISRTGRGPKRSMRIPSGRVVALSTKEPMVKPRLSISSCWLQLSHGGCASWLVLVVFSAEEGEGKAARDRGSSWAQERGLGSGVPRSRRTPLLGC